MQWTELFSSPPAQYPRHRHRHNHRGSMVWEGAFSASARSYRTVPCRAMQSSLLRCAVLSCCRDWPISAGTYINISYYYYCKIERPNQRSGVSERSTCITSPHPTSPLTNSLHSLKSIYPLTSVTHTTHSLSLFHAWAPQQHITWMEFVILQHGQPGLFN